MILLGLGSNLGNRENYLRQAKAALVAFDIDMVLESSIHETPALLPPGAPEDWNIPYLNQVIAVNTHHAPLDLLNCLKQIESDLGRKDCGHWAPREIDLDILTYGNDIILEENLTIPHPQLDARKFVLEPMVEIAPDWVHPIFEKTARKLLSELK